MANKSGRRERGLVWRVRRRRAAMGAGAGRGGTRALVAGGRGELRAVPGTGSLLLTGLDDYEGPPEGHWDSVRVHDGHPWLGSCREFARVLPPEQVAPPLVLRGLAQSDQLRAALMRGTRRALDLEETASRYGTTRASPSLNDCCGPESPPGTFPQRDGPDRPGARRKALHARPRIRPTHLGTVVRRAAEHPGSLGLPRHPAPRTWSTTSPSGRVVVTALVTPVTGPRHERPQLSVGPRGLTLRGRQGPAVPP